MDAGALGCEVILAGKITGPRSRTEKFLAGYIKHCGKPAEDLVMKGYAVAKRKLGSSESKSSSCLPELNFLTTYD